MVFTFSMFANADEAEEARMLDWAWKKWQDYKKHEQDVTEAKIAEAEQEVREAFNILKSKNHSLF